MPGEPTPGAPSIAASSADDAAVVGIVTRLSSEYLLRVLQLFVDSFGDFRSGIIAQTVISANTAHLDTRSGGGWRYAGIDETAPDALRRPVSIARLADASGLPFETTRRIVMRLIEAGMCTRREGGVIVPVASLQRPELIRAAITHVGYVRRFVRDLQALGLVQHAPFGWTQIGDEAPARDRTVARVVFRVSAEYCLRALRLLVDTYGDLRDGVIAQTIVAANTAHLDARGGEGWRYASVDQALPDDVRKPISITRLAESLGLPFESTRRHVRRLTDAGVCLRVEGGLIVPQAVLAAPQAAQSALVNVASVRRFVRDLAVASLEVEGRPAAEG